MCIYIYIYIWVQVDPGSLYKYTVPISIQHAVHMHGACCNSWWDFPALQPLHANIWNLLDIYWILIDIYWNVINIILESGAMVYQRLLLGIAQAVPCKSPWQNMAPWHLAWFLQSGGAMVEWAGI